MARPVPFKILQDLAKESMQKALESLGEANAQERKAKEQLVLLQQYRHDYLERMQDSMQKGVRSSVAYNAQLFIDNIDDAIAKQNMKIEALGNAVTERREAWMVERRKMESMSALLSRQDKQKLLQENRRDQKMNDEYAARSYRRMQLA